MKNDIYPNAAPGTRILDCSTIDIEGSKQFIKEAKERGFLYIDAPVSGGIMGAQAGTLKLLVGAESQEIFDEVEPIFQAFGDRVFFCGEPGTGQIAKVVNNMIVGI